MKTIMSVLFILISIIVFSEENKLENKTINFRDTKWGMSKAEVIKSEKIKLTIVKEDACCEEGLEGELKIDNIDMGVAYLFVDDKLCAGGYSTSIKNLNVEECFDIYSRIKKILIDKYGKPDKEDDKNIQEGIGLYSGKIELSSMWIYKDVVITLNMESKKNSPKVVVGYVHIELLKLKKKKQDETIRKNF